MQRLVSIVVKFCVPLASLTFALPALAQTPGFRSNDFWSGAARYEPTTQHSHRAKRHRARSRLPAVGETAAQRAPQQPFDGLFSAGPSSDIVAEARRWIGGNPTQRRSLWCARFMNFVLRRAGVEGTGSDMARSFAHFGRRVPGPQVGAIAVMSRGRRGGHVGVVSGIDPDGNPIIISGNHNNRVAEAAYPRGRVRAYVVPGS
jgi:uncharacterized protein (TIGR02594 family)